MNNKRLILLALAGAALVAASQAHAAPSNLSYSDNDLLLNFRDSVDDAGNDATIDLGNVNTFLSAVGALPGQTAVLDSGNGYTTSVYPTQFVGTGANGLINKVGNSTGNGDGTADNIGFSAAAENLQASGVNANTLWLTRQITSSQLLTGGTPSGQQGATAQVNTADLIQLIGLGGESSTLNPNGGAGTLFTGALNGALVPDANANSYHSLVQDPSSADLITYGGFQNGHSPGPIEGTPTTGTVYEALWEVPQTGNGSDTYEGYFTFQPDGEISFTTAVPEPSTYGLLEATGLVALVMRRQKSTLKRNRVSNLTIRLTNSAKKKESNPI